MNRLIQIFLDPLIIIGIKTIRVPIIEINVFSKEVPINNFAIIKVAMENAIPTP